MKTEKDPIFKRIDTTTQAGKDALLLVCLDILRIDYQYETPFDKWNGYSVEAAWEILARAGGVKICQHWTTYSEQEKDRILQAIKWIVHECTPLIIEKMSETIDGGRMSCIK